MRRADRLFSIIQIMRQSKLVRARDLAERLEISERTVYRDIQDLIASGVPIEGEAGVGYVMRAGFDLPPIMFTETEVEALLLGARIVESSSDAELARASCSAIAKVEAVLPPPLRDYMEKTALLAPSDRIEAPIPFDIADVRHALRGQNKIRFTYTDGIGAGTCRTVRPLSLAYFGAIWLLAAWCELREDFRVFRLDRMANFESLDDVFRHEPGRTLSDFLSREETWRRGKRPTNDPYLLPRHESTAAEPSKLQNDDE
ncbi:MAG: YafY family protein [Pseudomonadota bacterium]